MSVHSVLKTETMSAARRRATTIAPSCALPRKSRGRGTQDRSAARRAEPGGLRDTSGAARPSEQTRSSRRTAARPPAADGEPVRPRRPRRSQTRATSIQRPRVRASPCPSSLPPSQPPLPRQSRQRDRHAREREAARDRRGRHDSDDPRDAAERGGANGCWAPVEPARTRARREEQRIGESSRR